MVIPESQRREIARWALESQRRPPEVEDRVFPGHWVGDFIKGAAASGIGTWLVPLIFPPLRQSNLDMMQSINPRYLFVRP